jgi:transglutaminase-like putative cysteine protease
MAPATDPLALASETQAGLHLRTIRPIGVYQIHGLVWLSAQDLEQLGRQQLTPSNSMDALMLALDPIRGHLLLINGSNDHVEIINPYHSDYFLDARGLCLQGGRLWFCCGQSVYYCQLPDLMPQEFASLPYDTNGIAVDETGVYVTCQKSGYIHIFAQDSKHLIEKFPLPGIGEENLALWNQQLWVSDRLEQSVYCLDRATGQLQFKVLTPFTEPAALTVCPTETQPQILVAYAGEEPYVRDNPNNPENPLEIAARDRTSIHGLQYHYLPEQKYALSNGYLIEMSYVEEISPLEPVNLENLEWRIALPTNTDRQTVESVEPLGLSYTEALEEGERVAVFKFPTLRSPEARLFGWKARLAVRGIKYLLTPEDAENAPALSPEYAAKYLIDNDELAMSSPIVVAAAKEAIGTETNVLRKILKIRNYVYDRLSYGIRPRIDTPDVVLERGTGSCGEYVGVLLALARLNGVACRTVGRYKCPPYPDRLGVPLQPDFNHVWLEFYLPGFGWLPMESNPDDVVERGPYPTRFFMGLPWYHVEIGKGIRFETTNYRDRGLRLGNLALNHVRFTILSELPPL